MYRTNKDNIPVIRIMLTSFGKSFCKFQQSFRLATHSISHKFVLGNGQGKRTIRPKSMKRVEWAGTSAEQFPIDAQKPKLHKSSTPASSFEP